MGKFFDELFKNHSNQCNCKNHRFSDEINLINTVVDIEFDDPEEIINDYFKMIKEANSEDEVLEILTGLFIEGVYYGIKDELITDIQTKIKLLNEIEKKMND